MVSDGTVSAVTTRCEMWPSGDKGGHSDCLATRRVIDYRSCLALLEPLVAECVLMDPTIALHSPKKTMLNCKLDSLVISPLLGKFLLSLWFVVIVFILFEEV